MGVILAGLTLTFAALNWLAVEFHRKRMTFLTKPAALVALIAWFSQDVGWEGAGLWFGLGLVFSLAGDIFLLFPGPWFMPGLVAFLLTHLCYIAGFNQSPLPLNPLGLVFLAGILGADFWILKQLLAPPAGRGMALPVGAYIAAISVMAFSAMICLLRPEWSLPGAVAVALGAALFMVSDGVLAYNHFVAPTRHNDLVVMVTYHLAQIGIVFGLTLR